MTFSPYGVSSAIQQYKKPISIIERASESSYFKSDNINRSGVILLFLPSVYREGIVIVADIGELSA